MTRYVQAKWRIDSKEGVTKITNLYLNLDPILKKFCLAFLSLTGFLSRKKAWCSTAHFHRCLQAFSLGNRNTNVCSCSFP